MWIEQCYLLNTNKCILHSLYETEHLILWGAHCIYQKSNICYTLTYEEELHSIKCPWKKKKKKKHARLFEQNSGISGELLEKKTKCRQVMTDCHFFTISVALSKLFFAAEKIPESNDFDIWSKTAFHHFMNSWILFTKHCIISYVSIHLFYAHKNRWMETPICA